MEQTIAFIICAIFFFVLGVDIQRNNPKLADRLASALLINLCIICAVLGVMNVVYG